MINSSLSSRFGLEYMPTSFLVRMGKRELLVCRDFRKRFYAVNPVIECDTGVQAGHLEILLCRRWLRIMSKAHLWLPQQLSVPVARSSRPIARQMPPARRRSSPGSGSWATVKRHIANRSPSS